MEKGGVARFPARGPRRHGVTRRLAAVTVGGVGVGPAVDRGACRGDALVPALAQQDQNGADYRQQEEQAGDRDADGEAPLGHADVARVVVRLEAERRMRKCRWSLLSRFFVVLSKLSCRRSRWIFIRQLR